MQKIFKNVFIDCAALWYFIFGLLLWIIPIQVTMVVTVALFAIGFLYEKSIKLDFSFWVITIIFILLAYIDFHANVNATAIFAVMLPLTYLVGKMIAGKNVEVIEGRVYPVLLGITIGSWIQGLLDYSMNFRGEEIHTENWTEFWGKTPDISRSLFEIYFIFFTCLFVWALLEFRKHIVLSVLIVVCILATQYIISLSEGRMNLGILFGVTVITIAIKLLKSWVGFKPETKKKTKIALIVVACAVVVYAIAFTLNLFGLKDLYLNSYLNSSGGFIHNVRFSMMLEGLKMMMAYPTGGWTITVGKTLGMVNSTWFLFAQEYDTIIFFLFMVFIVATSINAIKLIINIKTTLDYWLVALFSGFNVYFLLETCPWRHRSYFVFLLLVCGIIRGRIEAEEHKIG